MDEVKSKTVWFDSSEITNFKGGYYLLQEGDRK